MQKSHSPPSSSDTRVAISGAGPTGLMLACQLARRGIPTRIFDRKPGPTMESRALAVQARSLEAYAQLGIIEEVLAAGHPLHALNLHTGAPGAPATHRLNLKRLGEETTPYPYLFILEQSANERLLLNHLESLGGGVAWNTRLTDFHDNPNGVSLTLLDTQSGREHQSRADWLVGADGSHSAVRHGLQASFPGTRTEDAFFVADLPMTDLPPHEASFFINGHGIAVFLPFQTDGLFRLIGMMPKETDPSSATFPDLLPGLRRITGMALENDSPVWFSPYSVSHRCVDRFRSGHCLLAGDAAHIHSPVGGQGMNTGLQDAWNLGWKLSLVASGKASPALLDSYHDERHPVAMRLIGTTDRAFRLLAGHDPMRRMMRTRIMPPVMRLAVNTPFLRRFLFGAISQTAISFRRGSLAAAGSPPSLPGRGIRPGDRFPWIRLHLPDGRTAMSFDFFNHDGFTAFDLSDGRHLPVCREVFETAGIPLRTQVVVAAAGDHLAPGVLYLVRPDMHLALAGERPTRADFARVLFQP